MNTLNKLTAFAVLTACFALSAFAQTATTSTTLASQMLATDQNANLTSTSGVTSQGSLAGAYTTNMFIDSELMGVLVLPATGNYVSVQRGIGGTRVQQHASGATVWIGPPGTFLTQQPSGYCTAAAYPTTPVIAIATGKAYTCSGTNQWGETGSVFISGALCGSKSTTTTTTDNGMVTAATGNVVHQFTTNTTAGTVELTCELPLGGRADAGTGGVVTGVELLYGVQTTAMSSIAAATVKTVTYPASTTAGVAAAGTVAAAGGTYTVTPGTLQLTTTTTGQCFNEKVSLGTPVALNTDNQKLTIDQVFTTAGTSATVLQVCGLKIYYYTPTQATISLD